MPRVDKKFCCTEKGSGGRLVAPFLLPLPKTPLLIYCNNTGDRDMLSCVTVPEHRSMQYLASVRRHYVWRVLLMVKPMARDQLKELLSAWWVMAMRDGLARGCGQASRPRLEAAAVPVAAARCCRPLL